MPEVLVAFGVVAILLSLLAPAVQQAREKSRAISRRDNLRQLVLAASAHEAAHGSFPYTSTTWYDTRNNPPRRHDAVSPHRYYLLAYIDRAAFEKQVFNDPTDAGWLSTPTLSVVQQNRDLQSVTVPIFICPSDRAHPGATSYRANLGISAAVLPPSSTVEAISQRGAFVNGRSIRPPEFIDGLSNTALFSERALGDFNPRRYDPFRDFFAASAPLPRTADLVQECRSEASPRPGSEFSFGGATWLLGGWLNTWYNHALTPKSRVPDCGFGSCCADGGSVVVTARSYHQGGVHVAMGDGSVRFVSQEVDNGIWRAIGTRNGREVVATD